MGGQLQTLGRLARRVSSRQVLGMAEPANPWYLSAWCTAPHPSPCLPGCRCWTWLRSGSTRWPPSTPCSTAGGCRVQPRSIRGLACVQGSEQVGLPGGPHLAALVAAAGAAGLSPESGCVDGRGCLLAPHRPLTACCPPAPPPTCPPALPCMPSHCPLLLQQDRQVPRHGLRHDTLHAPGDPLGFRVYGFGFRARF